MVFYIKMDFGCNPFDLMAIIRGRRMDKYQVNIPCASKKRGAI
jgi:hypothetical protein